MESPKSRYIAEFLGTFILTIAVGCNTLTNSYVWGATSNACTLMVLIFAFGDVSGGHFNPAVSASMFIAMRMDFGDMMVYMLVQILGAAAGAVAYTFAFYQSFNVAPMLGFSWHQAAGAELIYTMMLCFVAMSCTLPPRRTSASPDSAPQFAALAIGFVLIAGAHGAGAISGGCFNPAIALAIDVSSAGLGFGWSIAYMGWELVGAALAGVLFRITRPGELQLRDPLLKYIRSQEVRLSMLVSEFLGTYILTVTVGLNVLANSRAGAWSIGASLMCMVYALGDVSGAHFNPAVTLALTASGRYESDLPSPPKAAMYMATQFLAGIFGAWTFAMMFGWETFSLGPVGHYTWVARAPVEIFFTSVLCLTVLSVATVKASKDLDEFFGFAIGACITVGGYAVGMVSGGTMNPAVTLGVASTSILCPACMHYLLSFVYILLEFLGGLVAAFIFKACRPEEYLGGFLKEDEPKGLPPASRNMPAPGPVTSYRSDLGPPVSTMQPPPQVYNGGPQYGQAPGTYSQGTMGSGMGSMHLNAAPMTNSMGPQMGVPPMTMPPRSMGPQGQPMMMPSGGMPYA